MSGTRVISTTSRRELSSSFFFLQVKTPKEIHAILTETLVCFLSDRAKDFSAPMYIFTKNIHLFSGHVDVKIKTFRKFPSTSPGITYETTLKRTCAIKRMRHSLNIYGRPIALFRHCYELMLYSRYIYTSTKLHLDTVRFYLI